MTPPKTKHGTWRTPGTPEYAAAIARTLAVAIRDGDNNEENQIMSGETVITIIGNLTSDPELRYTQNGLAVANFTIASTPKVFDKQANEWKDGDALFLRASVWREFGEHVAGSLTKGTRVIASGILKQRPYETKEGEKRSSMELDIDSIGPDLRYATAAVTKAGKSGARASAPQQAEPWAATAPAAFPAPAGFNDETPW